MIFAFIDFQKDLSDEVYLFDSAGKPWYLDWIGLLECYTMDFEIRFGFFVNVIMTSTERKFDPVFDSISPLQVFEMSPQIC